MAEKRQLTVNIINRNYPPNKGITGESAAELAGFLSGNGIHVNVVTIGNSLYAGGGSGEDIYSTEKVYGVRTFYNGKNKILRLLASLIEGYKLVNRSRKIYADWTIVMTDPPLLNFFASFLLKKNSKWILWSMDVYPAAFEAAGLIKNTNTLYRFIEKILRKNPPDVAIALGPVQREYLQKKYYPETKYLLLPCGIFEPKRSQEPPQWYESRDKIYFGYCGNIGEAHSLPFMKYVIDALNPSKNVLILSVYGTKASELKAYAAGRPGIVLVPSVKREDLGYIDVHLASLNKEWVNVCVPSKTVSSVCSGAAFLYAGTDESDNWELLKEAGWLIRPEGNIKAAVQKFISDLRYEDIVGKKEKAVNVAGALRSGLSKTFEDIFKLISDRGEVGINSRTETESHTSQENISPTHL